MISVFVRKTEAGPGTVSAGDTAGDISRQTNAYAHYTSSSHNTVVQRPANHHSHHRRHRPLSSVSDSALSGLSLNGTRMATEGHKRTRSRIATTSGPQWLAERSYTSVQDGTTTPETTPSWHLQPLFPDVDSEKKHREHPHRLVKILKRHSLTENVLQKQSRMEEEYKGMRDFTRSKSKSANDVKNHQAKVYRPPRGYTNFVTGKPLMHQDRPPSGRERAHRRFLEKLEAQNRMIRDLSDSDDDLDEDEAKHRVLRIPSCSDMDVCIHGSCTGTSLQLAMDGLRIANNIERSLSTEPSQDDSNVGQKKDSEKLKPEIVEGQTKNVQKDKSKIEKKSSTYTTVVTAGSSSLKPGKQYKIDRPNPTRKSKSKTEGPNNIQETDNQDKAESVNKLYEWSTAEATDAWWTK